MATIEDMYDGWCTEEIRWDTQVNKKVWLAWFNKWYLTFQKMILEYVSGKQNVANAVFDIVAWQSEYQLPLNEQLAPDFYSIIQLRVAYKSDKNWIPLYRVCKLMNLTDYNIKTTNGRQIWEPIIWKRISKASPRFTFVDKNHIRIYPTPDENVSNWLALSYNYIEQPVTANTNENTLNLPRYFFDAIEDYLTFRLYQAENPELATYYKQQFEETLHDNIYWLNKDKRPVDEDFADTRVFSHY
mgnify:CR=1 FL=1